jgi:hypothetical protein
MTERVNFHNQNFPPFQWQIFTIKLCILVLSSNFQRNIQLYDQMSNFLQSKSSTISMAFFHNQILHTSFELLHCSGHIREQKKMSFWWGNGVTDKQRKTTIYFFFWTPTMYYLQMSNWASNHRRSLGGHQESITFNINQSQIHTNTSLALLNFSYSTK